jgi:hypothetical protein
MAAEIAPLLPGKPFFVDFPCGNLWACGFKKKSEGTGAKYRFRLGATAKEARERVAVGLLSEAFGLADYTVVDEPQVSWSTVMGAYQASIRASRGEIPDGALATVTAKFNETAAANGWAGASVSLIDGGRGGGWNAFARAKLPSGQEMRGRTVSHGDRLEAAAMAGTALVEEAATPEGVAAAVARAAPPAAVRPRNFGPQWHFRPPSKAAQAPTVHA